MTAARPLLALVSLSDSFGTLWPDLAEELDAGLLRCSPGEAPPPEAAAVILAAGGEEDRALEVLTSIPNPAAMPVYLVGARPLHRFAVEALRRGAADYFSLPEDLDLLQRTVATRVDAARSRRRPSGPTRPAVDPFAALLGPGPALRTMLEDARRVAHHGDVTVLLQGETGTGKELLAHALHEASPRAAGPFVPVNCAAIPHELLESELFGHERGAFTDAHQAKPGLFEEADGGTLFLDEVGHLPLPLQGKLLRALEDRRIRRVGGTQARQVDVRIVTASHVDLAAAVADGTFREDLYYRLHVVALTLPPLRERGDDVITLAEAFLAQLAARYQVPRPSLTPSAAAALRAHAWPGNVRELRHAVERALLLSEPGTLDAVHFTAGVRLPSKDGAAVRFEGTLDEIQAAAAHAALARQGGNKTAAARQLSISRARLQRLLDLGGAP